VVLARETYDQGPERNLETLERDLKAVAEKARQVASPQTNRSLVIYLPALAGGGVERLRLHLAPVFAKAGFAVTFLLHRAEGELISAVPKGVRVVPLNCNRTLAALWPMVRFLRREKPEIVLSSLGHNNIMAIWAAKLAGVSTKVIVCQHNAMSSENVRGDEFNYWILPIISKMFLGKANGIMAVSKGVADDLAKVTGIPRDRISVIYNPVVFKDFDDRMNEPVSHPWFGEGKPPVIMGVGRFVDQKDFSTLVDAFAKVIAKRDARLILLGDGPLRDELKAQAEKLGVADKIDMPGFQQNPLPWMKQSAILAMSSRYEGFGNVLVEALACGTPVVSTDCTYGPSEILADGEFGPLVPVGNADAMAKALLDTLENPRSEETLRTRGRQFTVERAAEQYVGLFNQVTQS
jgi:glycosyltransferase involved in cell wall biosynthesis